MKPLTIEELKKLEVGDWVWVDYILGGTKGYTRKYANSDEVFDIVDIPCEFPYSDYGTTWLAYKNKEQAEGKEDSIKILEAENERLTTNNLQSYKDFLLNFAFVKDGEVYLRGMADDCTEIRLCDYIAIRATSKGCERTPQDILDGACNECQCELAALNIAAIQAAELRHRLSELEDKIENGVIAELPNGWIDTLKLLTVAAMCYIDIKHLIESRMKDSKDIADLYFECPNVQGSANLLALSSLAESKLNCNKIKGFEDILNALKGE